VPAGGSRAQQASAAWWYTLSRQGGAGSQCCTQGHGNGARGPGVGAPLGHRRLNLDGCFSKALGSWGPLHAAARSRAQGRASGWTVAGVALSARLPADLLLDCAAAERCCPARAAAQSGAGAARRVGWGSRPGRRGAGAPRGGRCGMPPRAARGRAARGGACSARSCAQPRVSLALLGLACAGRGLQHLGHQWEGHHWELCAGGVATASAPGPISGRGASGSAARRRQKMRGKKRCRTEKGARAPGAGANALPLRVAQRCVCTGTQLVGGQWGRLVEGVLIQGVHARQSPTGVVVTGG
jgi:hypothetical protein